MKFFMTLVLFLMLVAGAFIVGYKTEVVTSEEADAGASYGGIQKQDNVGGVRMGTGSGSGGSMSVKRCSIPGARC